MTRVSTVRGRFSPTGRTSPSCSTRRSFAWSAGLVSEISSRKSVPPLATSKRPLRSSVAPVKAPRRWPKSSLSSSPSESAAQLTATKRWSRRGPAAWMARATSSLPVPVSPSMRTVVRELATRAISSSTLRIAALSPTISFGRSISRR